MPNRVVYYGPFNNTKREELLEKSKKYLNENKGDKFYYILPNGKLFIKYREILLKSNQGAFDIRLFTFDDIIRNLSPLFSFKYFLDFSSSSSLLVLLNGP